MQPDDDIYVNAGDTYQKSTYYPGEDKERVQEEHDAAAIKAASYPIMADIADWFEGAIDACDSIDNVQIDSMTINGVTYERNTSIEAQLLALRLLKDELLKKYDEFKEWKRED